MGFELQQLEREAKRAQLEQQNNTGKKALLLVSYKKLKAAQDAYEERKLNKG